MNNNNSSNNTKSMSNEGGKPWVAKSFPSSTVAFAMNLRNLSREGLRHIKTDEPPGDISSGGAKDVLTDPDRALVLMCLNPSLDKFLKFIANATVEEGNDLATHVWPSSLLMDLVLLLLLLLLLLLFILVVGCLNSSSMDFIMLNMTLLDFFQCFLGGVVIMSMAVLFVC